MYLTQKRCPHCEKLTNHSARILDTVESVHCEMTTNTVLLQFTCIKCLQKYKVKYTQSGGIIK